MSVSHLLLQPEWLSTERKVWSAELHNVQELEWAVSLWNSDPGQETECTAKIDNISCLYIGLKKQNTASTERRSTPSNQESVYRLITSNTRIILKQRWGDSLNPYMTIFPKEIYALWLQLWCISLRQSWEMFAYFLVMKAYMIEAYCHTPG